MKAKPSFEPIEKKGVYYLSPELEVDKLYLDAREKEQRVHSDNVVAKLPEIMDSSPHIEEWKIRKQTLRKFLLFQKMNSRTNAKVLDIGCGNGWFTAHMHNHFKGETVGLDINRLELEQAVRVFNADGLSFCYGDIFYDLWPKGTFDIITLNSSVQYFSDIEKLLNKLTLYLKSTGEIHILDTPFYESEEVADAKKRTEAYYEKIGFPGMAKHYFHHSYECLNLFNTQLLFDPRKTTHKVLRRIGLTKQSFPWVMIKP